MARSTDLGMSIANLERYGFEVHDVEASREHLVNAPRCTGTTVWSANRSAAERRGRQREDPAMDPLYVGLSSIGFARDSFGIFQTLTSKRTRGPSGLPSTREYLYR